MTPQTILETLHKAGKKVQRVQLYRYLADCKIKPLGIRQRPANYPEDTAARILQHLGLSPAPMPPAVTAAALLAPRGSARLTTLAALKAARPNKNKPSTKGKK